MNISVDYLFPIPVLKYHVPVRDEYIEYISELPFNRTENGDGYVMREQHILEHDIFRDAKRKIDSLVSVFFNGEVCEFDRKLKPTHCASWCTVHVPGDHSPEHMHANSIVSGVWYLKTPENCGDIKFLREDYSAFGKTFSFDTAKNNKVNCRSWGYEPNVGDIYIFPSNLSHQVERNLSDTSRISLAFNYFVRGELFSELTNFKI